MLVWEEILVANGATVIMMWFLLICRRKNRENIHAEDKMYDRMARIALYGAVLETLSFLVDGKDIACGRAVNYVTNTLCFACAVTLALLWTFYVELRIYKNYRRTIHHARIIIIPWFIEMAVLVCNLFGTGIIFTISADNVYQRSGSAIIGSALPVVYFIYTTYLVYHSKRQGINMNFFPVLFFVGPCLAGVIIQLFYYGVTTTWITGAIAMTFIQMQTYAENLYTDELSGLYNRRFLNGMIAKRAQINRESLYGIMMDINDFKSINDRFGHNVGDQAICKMGDILFKSIPEQAIAIRYAGDEFIVLLSGVDEKTVMTTLDEINYNLDAFNATGAEVFKLSASMGYARFNEGEDAGAFLMHMDKKMYEEKRKYHQRDSLDE